MGTQLEPKGNPNMSIEHPPSQAGDTPGKIDRATTNDDILHGADQIGAYLNVSARRCFHMLENGFIPSFKLGARWAARKSRLDSFMAEQEDAS
jgi:hypothetical protein